MKFYISQLVETEKIIPILKKYDVGLEVVQFAHPYLLDNKEKFIKEYKEELGDLYGHIDLIIHGPYADLCPGTRDPLIQKVTSFRFNQVYEVARELKANKIVYHNGYTPKTYMNVEWIKNVAKFWNEFLEDKKDLHIVVENVLEEDYYLIDSLMKEINKDNFSLCIDIGHINAYSKVDLREWIDNLSYKINHIHLHNNYGDKDSHLGIYKGDINVIEILKLLHEKNNDITISLEVVNLEELERSLDILLKEGFIGLKSYN